MSTIVKLKVGITGTSGAELDAVLTELDDGHYQAEIETLNLKAKGDGVRDALQGLVKLIESKNTKLASGVKFAR